MPNITVKTETEVARIAGQPGEFTVTLKKPGEKIEFDVPFPLPDEMKVDENGKELDVEKQHEAYMAVQRRQERHPQARSRRRKFGAVILAAGWRPDDPAKANTPTWATVKCPTWSPTPVRRDRQGRQDHPALRRQGGQVGGFRPEPRQGQSTATSHMPARSPAWWR
jgi:hypothetical protein